ncbi:MAG TPA: DUF4239 domain-containing protein [Candidatus Omnitrophota bacterium]|nr:DUF4239 domain-containing protein [Candidatus Omnitrophota bacterium]
MLSILNSLFVFGCVFGGALAGLFIRTILPGHHMSEESRDAVKLGAGLIATLTALVLGLLISSAKDSFDSVNSALTQSSAKIILLDRTLSKYGPETQKAREQLKESLTSSIAMFWPEKKAQMPKLSAFEKKTGMEQVQDRVRELAPQSDPQRSLQVQAIQLSNDILQIRWLMIEQAQIALPKVFFVILLAWLTILFMCFGLLAPRNTTVIVVFFVCAVSVAGAMFLILEMNSPLAGMMKISSAPLIKAMELIGR